MPEKAREPAANLISKQAMVAHQARVEDCVSRVVIQDQARRADISVFMLAVGMAQEREEESISMAGVVVQRLVVVEFSFPADQPEQDQI